MHTYDVVHLMIVLLIIVYIDSIQAYMTMINVVWPVLFCGPWFSSDRFWIQWKLVRQVSNMLSMLWDFWFQKEILIFVFFFFLFL
jgi:hypothetical protein